MGQSRFTEDFKTDAIKQITERGHSVADVSQRLGFSTHSFYAWIKRHVASPSAQHVLKIVKQQNPDGTFNVVRSDIYHGGIVFFVPFTN